MPLTDLLNHWQLQNTAVPQTDFASVYVELKRLAKAALAKERPSHTLQATELANEVYLLLEKQNLPTWENRLHFFSVISLMMRRLLIDHARKKKALKRGDPHLRVTFIEDAAAAKSPSLDVLAVHAALEELAQLDKRHGLIAELKLFGGFTDVEIGQVLGLSSRTIKRDWRIIKGWLRHTLKHQDPEGPPVDPKT